MKYILLIIVTTLCFIYQTNQIMIPRINPLTYHVPPKFKIDLNAEPRYRWVAIGKHFKMEMLKFINLLDAFLPIPTPIYQMFGYWAQNINKYQEQMEEVQGLADVIGVAFDKVLLIQFLYEFTSFHLCTGVVARNNEGKILHGRNYDFEFFEFQSKLTAEIEFLRDGEYLFTSEVTVGALVYLTAIKKGKFMIHVNARQTTNQEESFEDIMNNLFVKQYVSSTYLIRDVMLKANNYQEAIDMLKTIKITAPIYYIVSGTESNEGCVIERNSEGIHGFYELNETTWFLVQTNYDRDKPDPPLDSRRVPAEKRMNETGGDINLDYFFQNVMTAYPNLNVATIWKFIIQQIIIIFTSLIINFFIYTTMGIPSEGYFNTSLFYGRLPYTKEGKLEQKI